MNFRYYNTNKLIGLILVLSVLYNFVFEKIEGAIKTYPFFDKVYSYIGVFSTISLITLTILLIDNFLWKWTLFGWKPFGWLIDIPNLNGRYKGKLISSFKINGISVEKICVMEIKQTASKFKINSYFGDVSTGITTSKSISISEELVKGENDTFDLFYNFSNKTAPLLTLASHEGTALLTYYNDKKLMGEYFNQKNNNGSIDVEFLQKKLIGRLN